MDLDDALARHDGIMRVSTLLRLGVTDHRIRQAFGAGRIRRPRRGWVARADADPALVAAAELGVVVTCISQAARVGLWEVDDGRWHVAAPGRGKTLRATGARVHWAKPVVARHPEKLVDPIENALVLVAQCQPHEDALAIWESALRQNKADMRAIARLDLPPAARRVLAEVQRWADSGLESVVVPRLRWLGLPLRRQVWIAGHRVDLLIGDRLVLQIDGGHHVGPQRDQDNAHDAELRLLGYHVIRVGWRQIQFDWASVQDVIVRSVAQGLHRAC